MERAAHATRVGILGTGMIGGTMARLLVDAGYEVALSNSRGPASLAGDVAGLGPRARAETADGAATFGDVVFLAVPFRAPEALPDPARVVGRVVIDAMNPYAEGGGMLDLGGASSSEVTARRLPGARVVKAFNTIYWQHLATQGRPDLPPAERRAIIVAGDDADAKAVVAQLIDAIGFGPVDAGPLAAGRRVEPGTPLYDRTLTAAEAGRLLTAPA